MTQCRSGGGVAQPAPPSRQQPQRDASESGVVLLSVFGGWRRAATFGGSCRCGLTGWDIEKVEMSVDRNGGSDMGTPRSGG